MTRFTYGDALPLGGNAAPLLTAAIALPYPVLLTELAQQAGISRFAAARAAPDLVERELLLVDAEGWYRFNDGHDLAEMLCSLVWRFSGVARPDLPMDRYWPIPRPANDWQDQYHYQGLIPDLLLAPPPHSEQPPDAAGPNLIDARDLHTWVGQVLPELRSYERDGQWVFRRWSTERLRDMIHQTLHFGSALIEAQRVLSPDCTEAAQADSAPQEAHVSAQTWATVTYLVSAEARDVLRVVSLLDAACHVGGRVNNLRDKATSALDDINYAGQSSQFHETRLEQALTAAADAAALWADDSYGPYKRIGGLPIPRDVGTAGDQIYAVRLLSTATMLAEKVNSMSAHPSFQRWAEQNPAATAQVDLLREIPQDALRGHRDAQRPPPRPGEGPFAPEATA